MSAATSATVAIATTSPRPRLVLDTNVVMDLFHFANPTLAPLMQAIVNGSVICLANSETLAELQRVTGYAQFRLDAAGRADVLQRYGAILEVIASSTMPQPSPPLPRCKDPDDQMFLELALRGRADFLISRDKLVLKLARARQRPCPFAIVTPEAVIERLGLTRQIHPAHLLPPENQLGLA